MKSGLKIAVAALLLAAPAAGLAQGAGGQSDLERAGALCAALQPSALEARVKCVLAELRRAADARAATDAADGPPLKYTLSPQLWTGADGEAAGPADRFETDARCMMRGDCQARIRVDDIWGPYRSGTVRGAAE